MVDKKNAKKNVNDTVHTDETQPKAALASIKEMKEEHEPEYINIYWDEWQ